MAKQGSPARVLCCLLAVAIRSLHAQGFGGLYDNGAAGFVPGGLGSSSSSYGLLGGSAASFLLGGAGGGFYSSKSYIPAGSVGSSSGILQQLANYGYGGAYNPGQGYGGLYGSAGSGGYPYGAAGSGGYPYGAVGSGGYPYSAAGSGGYLYGAAGSGGYPYGAVGSGGGGFGAPGVPVIPELKVSLTGPGGFPVRGAQVGAVAQYGYPGSPYAGALYNQQVSTDGYPGGYPTLFQSAGGQHVYPGGYLGVQAQQQFTPGIGAVSSVLSKQASAFTPYG